MEQENMNKKIKENKQKIEIQQECQYQLPNCQKIAISQRILKLGSLTIDKGWICGNCQQEIEKERQQSPTAVFQRMKKNQQK